MLIELTFDPVTLCWNLHAQPSSSFADVQRSLDDRLDFIFSSMTFTGVTASRISSSLSYNSGEEMEIGGIFSFLESEGSISGVGAFHEWLCNDLDSE